MKKLLTHSNKLLQTLTFSSLFFLASCDKTQDVEPDTLGVNLKKEVKSSSKLIYGPETEIGDGTARVWVEMMQGKPAAIGVELTEEVLNSITELDMFEIALKLPGQAHATGYKTVMLGWNPLGHEPAGVYTVPHFDFHFYMQTEGQIMQIEGGLDPEAETLAGTVFPSFYTYGPVPFAVPHMGVHWLDVRSPEFTGAGFSRTFIYGSYHDRVTFLEPMVTLAYLESLSAGDAETLPVPALLKYMNPGYYAGSYTITHSSDGTYSIALTDLIWRNQSR